MSSQTCRRLRGLAIFAGCSVSITATMVQAQNLPPLRPGAIPSKGPDVIVGELYGSSNRLDKYTAPADAIQAYSVGTYSCNKGDEKLLWIASDSRHPVITQNLFRFQNGRFEQLGQAWLKHGFTALQGTQCTSTSVGSDPQNLSFPWSACAANPDGTYLGIGCSDPYSASLNGSQPSAGPKSEINAATGAFPFPRSFAEFPGGVNPGYSGTIARRLQVLKTDLVSGARYFVESQYVAPDDAASGNKHNNSSYREVALDTSVPSTLDLSFVAATVRELPAIFAWQAADSSVKLAAIDVPQDGRFWIGWKVTNNGNGTWTYEYALQNLNSHRSATRFSVPMQSGTVVTGTGFRDVPYHSGEELVYDQTDWTISAAGTQVNFTSPTPSGSLQPNALRWSTLYNFRFTANRAPTPANATIGLMRPGSGLYSGLNEVGVTIDAPGAAPDLGSAPVNNACANAIVMDGRTVAFTNELATTDGPTECTANGNNQVQNDLWYSWTYVVSPSSSCTGGTISFSTCGSGFDTKLAVYAGGCPTAPGTALACNDDDASCGTGSVLTVAAVANQTYLIRVGGSLGARGNGMLSITPPFCPPVTGACCTASTGGCSIATTTSCTGSGLTFAGDNTTCSPNNCPQPPGPLNDLCSDAQWIADNVPITATNTNSGTDFTGTVCIGNSRDVWYKYRPATTGNVRVTTNNVSGSGSTNYDTVLVVMSGCGGTVLGCNDDSGTPGNSSNLPTVAMTAGQTYLIRVSGYLGATGTFTLRVIGGGGTIPTPSSNDNCQQRQGVFDGTTTFDTTNATTDGPTPAGSCSTLGQISQDIWFNYPAQTTGTLTISTQGSSFDTRVAVYQTSLCAEVATTLVACNDNAGSGQTHSFLQIPILQGQSYTLRIGGNSAGGAGQIALSSVTTLGACCDAGGDCHLVTAASCPSGSVFNGAGSVCSPNPCPRPTGACCTGTACAQATAAACTGTFIGVGTVCGPSGNPTTCCPANFNQVNGLEVADIFAFIQAWFAGNLAADFDRSGILEVSDIFMLLQAWFRGC